ncbi:MAG: hypothetical protein K5879_10540 [Lachnospiraceae bacterium]|nr:hypothetical protein [Lachnospiraceae bacterium]
MMDILESVSDKISSALGDAIQSAFDYILYNFIYVVFYYIEYGFCKLIWVADNTYEVFTGSREVWYNGKTSFLTNVFFQNSTINKVYWGMALLGVVFAFGFAIIAVIRKVFDLRDKDQRSAGQILGSLFKTILLILSMNFIMIVVLNATNILMQQIDYVFNNAGYFGQDDEIVYTDEQYAAMARCLNTIGNYSTNPARESHYNVNACYNAIRPDLDYLCRTGVFDFYYPDREKVTVNNDNNGVIASASNYKDTTSWQSVLQKIVNAHNVQVDLPVDVFNDNVQNAVTDAMDILERNPHLRPLKSFKRSYKASREHIPLDRYVFLIGTLEAANNPAYNTNPEMTDAIRGPYYYGEKDIYSLSQVKEDFDISIMKTNYLMVYFMGVTLFGDLAMIILTCVSRIFNMLMLYLISPLVFAAEPLDDGAKRKQWTTAFLVQCCAVFGTIVAMRTLMVFIPIIMSSDLVFFKHDDPTGSVAGFGYAILNLAAKIIMIYGGFEVVKKANGIITGILADSAGWQSISAGDMSQAAAAAQGQFSTFVRSPFTTTGTWMKGFGNFATGKDAKDAYKAQSSESSKGGGGGGTNLPGSKR